MNNNEKNNTKRYDAQAISMQDAVKSYEFDVHYDTSNKYQSPTCWYMDAIGAFLNMLSKGVKLNDIDLTDRNLVPASISAIESILETGDYKTFSPHNPYSKPASDGSSPRYESLADDDLEGFIRAQLLDLLSDKQFSVLPERWVESNALKTKEAMDAAIFAAFKKILNDLKDDAVRCGL